MQGSAQVAAPGPLWQPRSSRQLWLRRQHWLPLRILRGPTGELRAVPQEILETGCQPWFAGQDRGRAVVAECRLAAARRKCRQAIDLHDAGAKRFPTDAEITKAIEAAKTTGDAAELEALRSLGYIE